MKKTSSIFLTLVSGLSFQLSQAQNGTPPESSRPDTLAPPLEKSRYYYDYDDDYSYIDQYHVYCTNIWFDFWPNYWYNWPGWNLRNAGYYYYPRPERPYYWGARRNGPYYSRYRGNPYNAPRRNRSYGPVQGRGGNYAPAPGRGGNYRPPRASFPASRGGFGHYGGSHSSGG